MTIKFVLTLLLIFLAIVTALASVYLFCLWLMQPSEPVAEQSVHCDPLIRDDARTPTQWKGGP